MKSNHKSGCADLSYNGGDPPPLLVAFRHNDLSFRLLIDGFISTIINQSISHTIKKKKKIKTERSQSKPYVDEIAVADISERKRQLEALEAKTPEFFLAFGASLRRIDMEKSNNIAAAQNVVERPFEGGSGDLGLLHHHHDFLHFRNLILENLY